MGLNRELREINRQMLTDKQQRQIDRQERQQLKDLQLVEQAQKQHLQLFIKSKIQYYLDLNFSKYKNDLYLLSFKNEIQQDFINKNKEYIDIVFIYFDEYYYKILKQQLKIFEMNQKAAASNTPLQPQMPIYNTKTNLRNIGRFLIQFSLGSLLIVANICRILFGNPKRRF